MARSDSSWFETETHRKPSSRALERRIEFVRAALDVEDAWILYWERDEAARAAERAYQRWLKRNPVPERIWDEATDDYLPGHGAMVDAHLGRRMAAMKQAQLGLAKGLVKEAFNAHLEAAKRFAEMGVTNLDELELKAMMSIANDDHEGTIARSCMKHLLRFGPNYHAA